MKQNRPERALSKDSSDVPTLVPRDRLFLCGQYLAPQRLVSRLAGRIASCRLPVVKNWLISRFVRRYGVEMHEAVKQDPLAYDCFNDFFTRELKSGARRFDDTPGGVQSPVDGTISCLGEIADGCIIQAKGHNYGLLELLGGDAERASPYVGGQFATIYLSPSDYHRVHMPVSGRLREIIHIPGRLFSVNPLTARHVPRLFARNERVVCTFETEHGPLALILVGAMIVASIETIWTGPVTPSDSVWSSSWLETSAHPTFIRQGQEMGLFKLGSTVIMLFGPKTIRWTNACSRSESVRVGQLLGIAAVSH
ncbi:phosphatidylserine decarboxylase [Cupriavidus sp. YR651]|uniref:archaetidylserine decarboxylase n=1 Tax=Cupriavidus sp. YR651 TaxID=1855315 RepID=UPI00088D3BDB|nr:archaetidylserine decarboxylase [Cupriavidus sp. YR651]SDD95941.1 phosphatidylserine decarboxylase [Cupriavidus sp. YR651]